MSFEIGLLLHLHLLDMSGPPKRWYPDLPCVLRMIHRVTRTKRFPILNPLIFLIFELVFVFERELVPSVVSKMGMNLKRILLQWGEVQEKGQGSAMDMARRERVEAYFRKRGWYIGHIDSGYQTTAFSFETSTKISNFISCESKPNPACLPLKEYAYSWLWGGVAVSRELDSWVAASFFLFLFILFLSFVCGWVFVSYLCKAKAQRWSKAKEVKKKK